MSVRCIGIPRVGSSSECFTRCQSYRLICFGNVDFMMQPRPSNVTRFEQLMYGSLVLYLVEVLVSVNWKQLSQMSDGLELVRITRFLTIWSSFLFVFLVWTAARRRTNWARWLLLIWFFFSLLNWSSFLISGSISVGRLLALAWLCLDGTALSLIFTGNAREWYRPSGQATVPLQPV